MLRYCAANEYPSSCDRLTAIRAAMQIANPSPGGGRINVQYRRVECAPPSDLVVNVDNNGGSNSWIRLQVTVRPARVWAPHCTTENPDATQSRSFSPNALACSVSSQC